MELDRSSQFGQVGINLTDQVGASSRGGNKCISIRGSIQFATCLFNMIDQIPYEMNKS